MSLILPPQHFVTPAKAGAQLRWLKFIRQELDSRLRGNDAVKNNDEVKNGVAAR
jgi:hypothetical protein